MLRAVLYLINRPTSKYYCYVSRSIFKYFAGQGIFNTKNIFLELSNRHQKHIQSLPKIQVSPSAKFRSLTKKIENYKKIILKSKQG
jgi:hypothetical protein